MSTFSAEEAQKAMEKFILDQLFDTVNFQGWDTQRYPFVGLFLNIFFHGVTLAMYGYYLTRHSKHAKLEQFSMFFAMVLTTYTSTILLVRDYNTFVLKYGLPDAILNFHWSSEVASAVAGPIYAFSNIFYARRLFPFFRNNIWVKIAAYTGIAIVFGLSIGTAVILVTMPKITVSFFHPDLLQQAKTMNNHLLKWYTVFIVSAAMTPFVEGAICFATIYKVQREQKNADFKSTSALLTHIATVSMSSMLVPTIAHFTTMGLFTHNRDAKKSQCLSTYIEKLVLISLFALFADRDELRRKRKLAAETAAVSIQLDTVRVTSEPNQPTVGWNRRMSTDLKAMDVLEWDDEERGKERVQGVQDGFPGYYPGVVKA